MTPVSILAAATQAGVILSVRAGTVYAAPPGLLSAALVDEIRAHKAELVDLLAASPGCTSCAGPVDDAQDLLCGPCFDARRLPGRLLQFDPARRLRTEARLATRRCDDCGGSWWRIHPNGDAECEPCRRARVSTPPPGRMASVPEARNEQRTRRGPEGLSRVLSPVLGAHVGPRPVSAPTTTPLRKEDPDAR